MIDLGADDYLTKPFSLSELLPLVAQTSPAAALFHEGLMLERAQGKVQDAIFRYERVIAEFPSDKEIVPQALHHLALLYAICSSTAPIIPNLRLTGSC